MSAHILFQLLISPVKEDEAVHRLVETGHHVTKTAGPVSEFLLDDCGPSRDAVGMSPILNEMGPAGLRGAATSSYSATPSVTPRGSITPRGQGSVTPRGQGSVTPRGQSAVTPRYSESEVCKEMPQQPWAQYNKDFGLELEEVSPARVAEPPPINEGTASKSQS